MRRLFLFYIIFIISQNIFGQVYAPDANYVDTTSYPNDSILGQDSIFVFHTEFAGGWVSFVELEASFENNTGLNFEWFEYNETNDTFDIVPQADSEVYFEYNADSSRSILYTKRDGGFKVHITKEGIVDSSFIAWVYIDYLRVDIEVETTCTFTRVQGIEGGNSFSYFDLIDHSRIILENGLNIEWTADPPTEGTLRPNPAVTLIPPNYEDTEFSVVVRDSFNNVKEDQKYVLAIATKADFYASEDMIVITDSSVNEREAPYKAQFVDSSKNAYTYEWKFYNDLEKDWTGNDTMIGTSDLVPPIIPEIDLDSIIYYRPGNYDITLVVYGPAYEIDDEILYCMDSLYKMEYINVDTSTINIPMPNVFVPGSKPNDMFKVYQGPNEEDFDMRSLRSFEIYIYNRWGKKLYEFEDDKGDWPGWNGEIKGEGRLVEPGVYYYVIKAEGWDGRPFELKSFFHVFHSK